MNEEVETQEAETQEVQAQETVEQEQPQEQVAERPDWLPEKFERPEELANSYKELERSFYKRKDEFREQIINELNDEAVEGVPTSPADYEVNIKAPEGMEFTVNEDDPLLNWFRDKAHDYGLNQEDFDGLVNEWATMDAMRGPDWNVESEALGEHAEKRLERVDSWASKNLSEDAYQVFANLPASAGMVQLYEELMELNGQPQFNMVSNTEFQERISLDELRSMQNDPKYWKEKDPAFISKVRAGFASLDRDR
jgi:hypothetical protein